MVSALHSHNGAHATLSFSIAWALFPSQRGGYTHPAYFCSPLSIQFPPPNPSESHRYKNHGAGALLHPRAPRFAERGDSVGRIERRSSRVGSLVRGLNGVFGAGNVGRQRQTRKGKERRQEIRGAREK